MTQLTLKKELRDEFAMAVFPAIYQAMHADYRDGLLSEDEYGIDAAVIRAYRVADEMLYWRTNDMIKR